MVEPKITAVQEEDSTLVLTVSEVRNFIGGPRYSTVHISTPHIKSSHEMRLWLYVQYQSLRVKATRVYQHLSVWRTIIASFPGPRPASPLLAVLYCKRREAGRGPGNEARTITHMVPTCSVLHLAEQRSICTLHVPATLMHYN